MRHIIPSLSVSESTTELLAALGLVTIVGCTLYLLALWGVILGVL